MHVFQKWYATVIIILLFQKKLARRPLNISAQNMWQQEHIEEKAWQRVKPQNSN